MRYFIASCFLATALAASAGSARAGDPAEGMSCLQIMDIMIENVIEANGGALPGDIENALRHFLADVHGSDGGDSPAACAAFEAFRDYLEQRSQ